MGTAFGTGYKHSSDYKVGRGIRGDLVHKGEFKPSVSVICIHIIVRTWWQSDK
jgi:hypothetical protein